MNESTNKACCGFFVDTLNRVTNSKNILKLKSCFNTSQNELVEQDFVINDDLSQSDVDNFLTYCNSWQQKQCVCIFTKDDLIEKFHHFLHQIISMSVIAIKNLCSPTTESDKSSPQVLKSSVDFKEKLLCALVKVFSLNMPLYLTYKHLLFNNHGRYSRLPDCSCSNLSQDSLNLIQIYCITSQASSPANKSLNQDLDNLPVEFLRNICHFLDLYGLVSIKECFNSQQSNNLPLSLVHLLFNLIVNIRVWLNPTFVDQQILSIRPLAIKYMCSLCDQDLRLAGTRNTIDLMYESFKLPSLNSYINQTSESSQSSSSSDQTSQDNCTFEFKIDLDGLTLANKYLTSSTLTIRLCGVAQMSLQINAWSEFNSLNAANLRSNTAKNELADWFVQNNIIEYLYGPNLHHELIKRSQDIVNFLAFTNRLTEKHLDVIWASAQLKYCSKSVMETLISLIKHLDINSVKYLSKLISELDLDKQTDQTLFLSALLTKTQWSLMLEFDDPRKVLNKSGSDTSQNSAANLSTKELTSATSSSSDQDDDKASGKRLRQRRQTVNSLVNNVDENDESEDEDYEESEEEEESEESDESEHESEDTEDLDIEVERVSSSFRLNQRNENCESSQDDLNEELIRVNQINEMNKFQQENGSKDTHEGLESHSSNVSNASSAKNLNDVDKESEEEETAGEESDSGQILNRPYISPFIENLFTSRSRLPNSISNQDANTSESNRLNLSDLSEPGSTFLWDLLMSPSSEVKETHLKIVKEAEKQFQIIICLPTTDRRIKFKFIESCIKNIHNADTCPIALRLLTKIFSSFQQYTANTFNFLSEFKDAKKLQPSKPVTDMHTSLFTAHQSTHPANEIHKAVALADFKFNLISEFFISLGNLDQSKEQHTQIQVRLQFLSFIYSTIGSVAAFDLSVQNVNDLWSCLAKFEHSSQIKDDIFNWFLNQAKNKDQHAISVDNFKLIFVHKMPVLEPNSFSLSALHLYQELFKIYKSSSGENEEQAKLMEQSAIDYILKLAFKSTLNEVSLSAIQFLNSHHCNNEGEFVQKCLEYLKKSRHRLQSGDCVETSLVEIQRGLLLLKNHLDLSQRKNSYRIRLLQIKEPGYLNHSKCLIDYSKWDGLIRFECHVNSTRFNFELVMTLSDCVGDLKAVVREILLNCIKSGKEMGSDLVENSDCHKLVFNSNNLNDVDLCKQAYSNLVQGNQNTEMFKLIHTLIEKEDALYIKLFSSGQELTTESKLLSELGLKDYQTIHVSLFSKSFLNQTNNLPSRLEPQTLPIVILSREENFKALFKLLNLLTRMGGHDLEPMVKKKICHLSQKCWKIINMLPSSATLLASIKQSKDFNLSELHQELLDRTGSLRTEPFDLAKSITFDRPYQLLYYIQLIEVTFAHADPTHQDKKMTTCTKYIYKLALLLANYLSDKSYIEPSSMLKFDVKLDCMNILFNLLNRCLIEAAATADPDNHEQTPKKRLKKNFHLLDKLNYRPSQIRADLFSCILQPDTFLFIDFILNVQCLSSVSQSDSSLNVLNQSMKLLVDSLTSEHLEPRLRSGLIDGTMRQNRLDWFKSLLICSKWDVYRKDASTWIHRLCVIDDLILAVFLPELIELMNLTSQCKPSSDAMACKEYFDLVAGLLSADTKLVNSSKLMHFIASSLESRDTYEILNANNPAFVEDNFLVGMLTLGCAVLKNRLLEHDLDQSLAEKMIDYLFATRDDMYPRVVLPKFRSVRSRELGFDFLLELCKHRAQNYTLVADRLMSLHDVNPMVLWDYWPRDDVRSICGYLGLVNLGATCYMATSLQHLFMINEARRLILESKMSESEAGQYDKILVEVKKIFAFLQESERKSYTPRDLCKVYTMDQQALNTGEQKDMQEFFTDLISKLEETSDPEMKSEIKKLFGGVITNVVISLDCPHVSSSLEEFYTVRCQVAGMKDLYESLNEITVKDTLEGDNMYTCSTCSKKVRAEKRACFSQLPEVLCLNTMRYTFNMVTMLKEKVNTYFSFPLELNMSGYMEQNLIESGPKIASESGDAFVYDLIGVTVHTGTADGGHYYSFIQEMGPAAAKWFFFNDAEVKQFDVDSQLAAECFGGETTSKTYDCHSDKYTDLSFEKTNSAYMLFYKKRGGGGAQHPAARCNDRGLLCQIWHDNLKFITDRLLFETAYFNFVHELCQLPLLTPSLTLRGAQLAITFFLQTFVHSREKHHILQWIDLLNKLFAHKHTCHWLLERLASHTQWLRKLLTKCPQVSIRCAFQKFLLGIAQRADPAVVHTFLSACVCLLDERAQSIRHMSEYFAFLTEYSRLGEQHSQALLGLDVVKRVCAFYVRNRRRDAASPAQHADSDHSDFSVDNVDSESECEQDIVALSDHRSKPKVFDKMLLLLVELSECHLAYLHRNYQLKRVEGAFKVPLSFFYKSILDGLSLAAVKQLLVNVTRLRAHLGCQFKPAVFVRKFVDMCVKSIGLLAKKSSEPDKYMNFFNAMGCLLSLEAERVCPDEIECALCENESLRPDYCEMVTQKLSDLLGSAPYYTLRWLAGVGNARLELWLLDNMSAWVKRLLIDAKQTQVRFSAAVLLANLVPDRDFRHQFTSNRNMLAPYHAEPGQLTDSFTRALNAILRHLLSLMNMPLAPSLSQPLHSANLIQYFTLLIYLLVTNEQKRLVLHNDALQLFWDNVFFKHMANSHVTTNLNKQVMIHFVYHCLNGCVQVLDYVTESADGKFEQSMARELPLCTVIVDHEDAELVSYNKQCLQPFYGAIRLLCEHSPVYLRHMCEHSNLQWAFKHVLPYSMHYGTACVELVKLAELVCGESGQIKESVCGQFLMSAAVEPKHSFQSIVWVVKAVMRTNDDVTLVLSRRGLSTLSVCLFQLVAAYSSSSWAEGPDLADCLLLLKRLVESVRAHLEAKTEGVQQIVATWKEKFELIKRLVVLASFWVAGSTRATALELMRAVLEVSPVELAANTVAILKQAYAGLSYYQSCHSYQKGSILSAKSTVSSLHKCFMGNQSVNQAVSLMGPYFPVPANCALGTKKLKPAFNLYLPLTLVNHCHYDGSVYMLSKIAGHVTEYEKSVRDSFLPLFNFYHFLFKRLFDQLSGLNEPNTKNLTDLVLIVSTQSMYFDIHFIGYLSERADCLAEHIANSIHLNHFVRVLITDYRHLVSRDEYAAFVAGFVGRFVRNLLPRHQLKSDSFSHLLSQTIKNTIRLSLSTINETRFYFEFSADKVDDSALNLDMKLSAMLGSIKCVHMVTRAVSGCRVDKQFVKFVKQLKDFFVSYWEHVGKQSEEMGRYLDDEGHRSKKVKLEEAEAGDLRARLESKRKCVGAVLEALKENIDLMNGLMQGVQAMDDESTDETTDDETSSSSSSSQEQEASTESGSNCEQENATEHEQTNA